jgi:hypothetical protein
LKNSTESSETDDSGEDGSGRLGAQYSSGSGVSGRTPTRVRVAPVRDAIIADHSSTSQHVQSGFSRMPIRDTHDRVTIVADHVTTITSIEDRSVTVQAYRPRPSIPDRTPTAPSPFHASLFINTSECGCEDAPRKMGGNPLYHHRGKRRRFRRKLGSGKKQSGSSG